MVTVKSNGLGPSCGGAVGIHVLRSDFSWEDFDLAIVKECLGARVKVLGVEAA